MIRDEIHEYKSDALHAYLKECTSKIPDLLVDRFNTIGYQNPVSREEIRAALNYVEVTKNASS